MSFGANLTVFDCYHNGFIAVCPINIFAHAVKQGCYIVIGKCRIVSRNAYYSGFGVVEHARDILLERIEINEGMLAENVVAQLLRANGHRLFFYSRSDRDDPSNRMEIDFLIVEPYENAAMKYRVSPIEVKSSKHYRTVSLDKFKAKFDKKVGTRYVLHPKPLVVENDVVKLPIYMAGLL